MKLRKFPFKSKGPLTEEEHEKTVSFLGPIFANIEQLFQGTGHILRGRMHAFRDTPCPCIYIYYSENSFNDDQRGRMYIAQDSENGGIEIVFREWEGQLPLPSDVWDMLEDDRYSVCKSKNFKWRTFKAETSEDIIRARELINMAMKKYEEIYDINK
jgi:hypothetical protein